MTPDTLLAGRPAGPVVRARTTRRWLPDLIGVLVVCVVILVGYYEVPFAGKTFSTSSQLQGAALGATVCGSPAGKCAPTSYADPRVDLGASAWQLEPWVQITHRELADGETPLWNPYEGIGMPLAGNLQSAVFDPLLLPLHLHPTMWVQDLSFLVGLMLIGLGAFLAARLIGLAPLAATVSGSIFGLSGWFFVYSNSQWFRTYLFLGFIVAFIEWTLRSKRRLPPVLLGLSIAGMALVGMPEPTFMALVAISVYCAIRIFEGPCVHERWRAVLRLGGAATLGLALAAPMLTLFREYLPLSQNTHAGLADAPPATDPASYFLNWLAPRISPSASSAFAGTRTWVGAGAMLLVLAAVSSPKNFRRYLGWPIATVGVLLVVQIYGGSLVAWTRFLPYWSQVLWPTFGTPIIALCIALLAGMGVQAIANHEVSGRRFLVLVGAFVVVLIVLVLTSNRVFAFGHNVVVSGGWPLAIVAAAVVIVAVLFVKRPRAASYLVAATVLIELTLLAPHDFLAPRQAAYAKPRWITYLSDQTGSDRSRVFSPDGLLFPDTAGVYGLQDPTMIDALYVKRYWDYLTTFVSHGLVDRYLGNGPYESATNVAGNPMFDILGIRYLMYADGTGGAPPDWSGDQFRVVEHVDGIKVYENTHAAPRAFVVHDVRRADDERSALRFLKRDESTRFPDGSVQVTGKDPRTTAVIEASADSAPAIPSCTSSRASRTRIVSYTARHVKIDVESPCAGLLVLSDQYYPGWRARVNGRVSRVYATDVALRGVTVPSGHSIVEFDYEPASFKIGLVLFVGGMAVIIGLGLSALLASPSWKRRRRSRDHAEPATDSTPENANRSLGDALEAFRIRPFGTARPGSATIFLDRDGILNRVRGSGDQALSPRSLEEVFLERDAPGAVRKLRSAGFTLIVITNQPDVARGRMGLEAAVGITEFVVAELALDDAYVCIHDTSDDCQCRKPRPGALLQAARDWQVALSESWMIGDRWVDIAAAEGAHVRSVLVERPYSWDAAAGVAPPTGLQPTCTVSDLRGAVAQILTLTSRSR
jgi:D-glycero-D-manno-heptose 1,7-bisphosphate phosphatase